jgi:hypothetical protein
MKFRHTNDKQLQGITLETVLEKRRLDQALNAKEFAVCAGISYSMAREWFRTPGFPAFRGFVFWQDFVEWRSGQNVCVKQPRPKHDGIADSKLPARAALILSEA